MFWTKQHVYTLIPTLIVELIIAIILGHFLKNKSEKIRLIPIQVIAAIMLLLEVWKQVYSAINGYNLYRIPFHFCSLFLYFVPLAAFYHGKYKDIFRLLAIVVSTCLFLFLVVYPDIVYGGDAIISAIDFITFKGGWFIDFHSWVFHGLAVFLFFLFMFLDLYEFNTKKDLKVIVIAFAIYCIIVGPFSQIVETNYNNFYHSNAPFLEDFRLMMIDGLGWGGQLIYVLMISIGTILVPILAYFVFKGLQHLKNKIANKESIN